MLNNASSQFLQASWSISGGKRWLEGESSLTETQWNSAIQIGREELAKLILCCLIGLQADAKLV